MPTKPLQFGRQLTKPGHDIQGEILFTRGEIGQEPAAGMTASLSVVIATKSDDCISPHDSGLTRQALHNLAGAEAILLPCLWLDTRYERIDAGIIGLGFKRHCGNFSSRGAARPVSYQAGASDQNMLRFTSKSSS